MSAMLATPAGRSMTASAASSSHIGRGGHIALRSPDPAEAAAFAAANMGFSLVHVDDEGRHYLAAAGLDLYSLVYVPGDTGIDHLGYLVTDLDELNREEERLRAVTSEVERIDENPLWRAGSALSLISPAGHEVRITLGVHVDVPMAALVVPDGDAPAPITADHFAVAAEDVDAEIDFARNVLGLKETARVVAPDVGPAIVFFRAHTLFHCYTVIRGPRCGLHHFQYTLKNAPAVHAAYERMRDNDEVEVIWGPLRHGPGHNVAMYFRDRDGHIVEYSAEEEIILDDAAYMPQEWSVTDPKFADEWGSAPPEVFFD